jgi:hypothetical protein
MVFSQCSSQNSAVVLPTAIHTFTGWQGFSRIRRQGQSITAMNLGSFKIILELFEFFSDFAERNAVFPETRWLKQSKRRWPRHQRTRCMKN